MIHNKQINCRGGEEPSALLPIQYVLQFSRRHLKYDILLLNS